MSKRPLPALAGRTIRCFLFDLGDTLWSRKDMHVWQQLETEANVRAVTHLRHCADAARLPDLDDVALGQRLREMVDVYIRTHIQQDPENEPDVAAAIASVLHQWGIQSVSNEQCAAIFEGLRVRIPESRPLYDDVLSTLHELQRRGFQLGVVTNRHWGGDLFQEDLQVLGLLNYFDPRSMAISIDLGIRKPNPAIFLHVLNALDIPPQEAVMVGDSLRSDVLGAQMLGLFTVWKPKPELRSEIYAQKVATGVVGNANSSGQASTQGNRPADLPAGMHITDDDYVLAHIESRAGKWDEHMQRDIKPDLIIENLSDLLDIFSTAGEQ